MTEVFQILHDYGLLLLVGQFPLGPLGGLALTLCLAVAGLAISFPLAVLVGMARTSSHAVIYLPVSLAVHLVRGLPVLMIIFWAYFIVPLVIGHSVSALTTVLCALVVYELAFTGEVIRAGIQAIPKGQIEAASSLGLNVFQVMRRVVLPQALFHMLPSILNRFISLVKNTSLGYIISLNELTYSAYQINIQLLTKPFQVYTILAITYFLICWSLGQAMTRLEQRIQARRERTAAHVKSTITVSA
ncbi:amino acid ABC transporter permease [Paraburkholderia nemoris]|uniref:Glutamine ABC transporter permease protein GlnP n=1 Tax=Paraburkholderia nemoris TaxID=2793076 RepID=A0ABN7NEY2_9BURK|nr:MULTISPECIES: amino acid ABC transporter permease [Paraburkholderia]MBK3816411.1 amino acid ABC transporter permease [Paraburkholderia aspalathi]CAE6850647.1 putative glutamine ABC transporter permease protein GlnP [Paraburkholderia nemoris]CAE6861194.1 putative glutamine ABC transporter permease protein GlnP [Paraburkholderia nemoris]